MKIAHEPCSRTRLTRAEECNEIKTGSGYECACRIQKSVDFAEPIRRIQATFCMVCEGKVGTKMFQFVVSRTFGPELDLTFGNRSPAWTDRVVRDEKDIFGGGLIEHSKDHRIFEYSAKHSQTIVSDRNGTTPNTCDKRQAQEESVEGDASEINR